MINSAQVIEQEIDKLQSVIDNIREMRAEFDALEAKLERNDMKRREIMDDYETMDHSAWLDGGFRK